MEESSLPFPVDLFIWDELPESFRKRIEAEHVVLVKKEEQSVRDGWEIVPLGELTDNFDAARVPVKRADRRPGPYPYYGASGIVDSVSDYLFDGEYLLIAEDGEESADTKHAYCISCQWEVLGQQPCPHRTRKPQGQYTIFDVCAVRTGRQWLSHRLYDA